MGGGVSANSCVENFEKLESVEGNSLTDAQRENLKKIAEDVLRGATTPHEVERNLDVYKSAVEGGEKSDLRDRKFLKYLAVEVMKLITRQAIEDAMNALMSGTDEDFSDEYRSFSKEQDRGPSQGRRK